MRLIVAVTAALFATAVPASIAVAAPDREQVPEGFKYKRGDTLVHEASKTEFPKELAGFTRVYEEPFDLTGHDVVIAYRREIEGKPVVARIALIHIEGMTPKEHYLGIKSLIGTYFRSIKFTDLKPAGEGPFDPPKMQPGSGYQGRFAALADGVPYELSLSTVSYGYWSARVTAAYPAADAPKSRAGVLALATALQRTGPAKTMKKAKKPR